MRASVGAAIENVMGIPIGEPREHFVCWLWDAVEAECRAAGKAPGKTADWPHVDADIARKGRNFIRAIERRGVRRTQLDPKVIEFVGSYLQQLTRPKRGAPKRDDKF